MIESVLHEYCKRMGLLDKIFRKDKSSVIKTLDKDIQRLEDYYSKTVEDLERVRAENKAWEKDFNRIISFRQQAQKLEDENKLIDAISVYLSSVEFGENGSRLNLNNYAHDIDRVIILYGKTKQIENLKVFLNDKITKYPNYRGTKDWIVRLSKLNGNTSKSDVITVNDIVQQKANSPTLGRKLNDFKLSMPEFNFYYDMPEGMNTLQYQNNVPFDSSKKLGEFREVFKIIVDRTKVSENEGDLKIAIEAYERLLDEEYEDPEPYERLITIYSKLKWYDQEIKTIERAISFFSALKERQLKYVYQLADKYGMRSKADEYIKMDKKIFYYLGAFELYNPQTTRINKWKERLEKKYKK